MCTVVSFGRALMDIVLYLNDSDDMCCFCQVDYKYNLLTGEAIPYERHGAHHFRSNLSVMLKWSPFATEEDLMKNVS
jgi:hypothetical protein